MVLVRMLCLTCYLQLSSALSVYAVRCDPHIIASFRVITLFLASAAYRHRSCALPSHLDCRAVVGGGILADVSLFQGPLHSHIEGPQSSGRRGHSSICSIVSGSSPQAH